MNLRTHAVGFFAILALSLAACSPGTQPPASVENPTPIATPTMPATPTSPTTPSGEGQGATVYVDSIEFLTLESFPVQIRAIVKGNLPDTCTTITSASSERDGNAFRINFVTIRPADAVCAQMLVPFEQSVALDVAGLKMGTYTVTAGEVTETFDLSVDNILR